MEKPLRIFRQKEQYNSRVLSLVKENCFFLFFGGKSNETVLSSGNFGKQIACFSIAPSYFDNSRKNEKISIPPKVFLFFDNFPIERTVPFYFPPEQTGFTLFERSLHIDIGLVMPQEIQPARLSHRTYSNIMKGSSRKLKETFAR